MPDPNLGVKKGDCFSSVLCNGSPVQLIARVGVLSGASVPLNHSSCPKTAGRESQGNVQRSKEIELARFGF